MALPEGITPKTVTVGIPTKFNGQPATGSATLTAPTNLVHTPTGTPLFSGKVVKQFQGLAQVEFTDLVPTDAAGLNRVDWTYTLTVRVNGAIEQPEPIVFVLPEAGPDTLDAETLVEVPSSAGTPVSVDVVTTTGFDAAVAAEVADGASDTTAALSATYGRAAPVLSAFVYDDSGNLTSYEEDGITITLTYNADGTVATSTRGAEPTQTYSYSDGNLVGVA